jgi:SAM-dependent methyltransferase
MDLTDDAISVRFQNPTAEDVDVDSNLEWNRQRWGQEDGWRSHDGFGYQWGRGYRQSVPDLAAFTDEHFKPWTDGRRDLTILELAPGGGRFTAELIRYARRMCLVDLNEVALELCRERFQYYPTEIQYVLGDGKSLEGVPEGPYDMVACFDSMVHMRPEIIESYVGEFAGLMAPGGIAWLDHSGKGEREQGHRTPMTDALMREFAESAGLEVVSQRMRNPWDCISVLRRPAG